MQQANKHIVFMIVLVFIGMLVHSPCNAQDSNMRYWAQEEQAQRNQLSHVKIDFNYIFCSRVVCDSSLNPIRNCNIINKTQRTGTMSDMFGDFKIMANINDSIYFSSIGYETLTIVLTDSMFTYGHIIKLKPMAYHLNEITIQPLFVLPQINKWEIYTPPLPNQGGINIPTSFSPITFLYNRFSKEGKQRRYYEKVKEGTADFMLIGEKFNGAMVSQLTGLKDDELIAFMSFCNFSNDFLMNYSMETIKRAIRKKFQEYLENKNLNE